MLRSATAEAAVLRAVINSRRARMEALAQLRPQDFAEAAHREVWGAIRDLVRSNKPVTLEELKERLEGRAQEIIDRVIQSGKEIIDPAPLIRTLRRYADARSVYRQVLSLLRAQLGRHIDPYILRLAEDYIRRLLTQQPRSPSPALIHQIYRRIADIALPSGEALTNQAVGDRLQEVFAELAATVTVPRSALPSRSFEYAHAVWEGQIGRFIFKRRSPKVTVFTGRHLPAARAVIDLTNFRRDLEGEINRDEPVIWRWGYLDPPVYMETIFEGYVVEITSARRMIVEARDKMWEAWRAPRTQAFRHEEAGAILEWFVAEAGLPARIHKPGVILPHFVAEGLNASDVAVRLNETLAKREGIDTSDWAHFIDHDGIFCWGPYPDISYQPYTEDFYRRDDNPRYRLDVPPIFARSENIVRLLPDRDGLSCMETFAVPECRHSMDILIDGEFYRTEQVIYRQEANQLRMEVAYRES